MLKNIRSLFVSQAGRSLAAARVNTLFLYRAAYIGSSAHMEFRTQTPKYSSKSQRGLFHSVTHHDGNTICFSFKHNPRTYYPNIVVKKFYSDILQKNIRLPVTTTAIRCMTKLGSFDNYILKTNEKVMNSKYGMFLKELMQKKMKDPKFLVPYLKHNAKAPKKKRPHYLSLRRVPSMYIPIEIRRQDPSQFYIKADDELSRRERKDMERKFRSMEDPKLLESMEEEMMIQAAEIREEIKGMLPRRNEYIKKYVYKFKDSPRILSDLEKTVQRSEDQVRTIMGEHFIPFTEAMPDVKLILETSKRKEEEKRRQLELANLETLGGRQHLRDDVKIDAYDPFEVTKKKKKRERIKDVKKFVGLELAKQEKDRRMEEERR